MLRFLAPALAGSHLRDRLIASLGALIGISLTAAICGLAIASGFATPLIVAPMGASAVLLFAVPASPLAQPWPIIGGNMLSAAVGLIVGSLVRNEILLVGLAVGASITVMSLTRSLHPPGGAMGLVAALGGKAVAGWGLWFPLFPVATNAILLVAIGILFHRLGKRNYPHVPAPPPVNPHLTADPPPSARFGITPQDVENALSAMHESFDIGADDLKQLLRQVEAQVLQRSHGEILCGDIMSRDVVTADIGQPDGGVHGTMIAHAVQVLPLTKDGRYVGTVNMLDLARGGSFLDHVRDTPTVSVEQPAMTCLPILTGGQHHVVVVTDAERHILGIISQTDLLASLSRLLLSEARA